MSELVPKGTPFGHGWSTAIYLPNRTGNASATDSYWIVTQEVRVIYASFLNRISFCLIV